MPLTGKYLKYSPEITLEILTLVQDKLKLCGMNSMSAKENYNYFKKGYEYLVGTQKNFFYTREKNSPDLLNKSETTVQEILEYDPFVKKEVIPKYVELLEGFDSTCTGKIFNTNQPIPQMSGWSNQWTWESIFKNDTQRSYFKPSTKEAFNAQNKLIEDTIECKECNGTGEVMIAKLYPNGHTEVNEECPICGGEGIIDKPKHPLKQAVHCTTQEEWDFVCDKINHKFHHKFNVGYHDTIDIINLKESFKSYYKDYQILSFQEWCDLNGYKMEKEVKFEVGKWYKLNNWISKFNYLEGDYKFYGENINTSTGFVDKSGWMDLNEYTPIEISIEEIQQYLPDNHIDKIKSNQEFKDGDWIVYYIESKNSYITSFKLNDVIQVINGKANNTVPFIGVTDITNCFRHATPEEIYNHSISIGQIPAEKYPFKKLEEDDLIWEIKTEGIRWTEPVPITKDNWKHEMFLSVYDEEFPMVNIIKTNTIKQLLSDD